MSGASRIRPGGRNVPQQQHGYTPYFDGPGSGPGSSGPGGSSARHSTGAPSSTSGRSVHSQGGSPHGSPHLSQSGFQSQAGTGTGSYGAPPTMLTDPARDYQARPMDALRMVDMPACCFSVDSVYNVPVEFTKRGDKFNTTGKEIILAVNFYEVTQYPIKTIYQYDVHIGTGAEKRVVIEKVWNSQTRKTKLPGPIIFDGNKLAWSTQAFNNMVSFIADLDAEQGRAPGKKPNTFSVTFRPTKKLNIAIVQSWVQGKSSFNNDVLEGLNFLQHLLRAGPEGNERFIALKNKFFVRDGQRMELGAGVEVWRGVFQSLRPSHGGLLKVNLDVANTCFWKPMALTNMIVNKFRERSIQDVAIKCRPVDGPNGKKAGPLFPMLKLFKKLKVHVEYEGCPVAGRVFTIKGFIMQNAKEYMLDMRDANGNVTRRCSVFDYFRSKYNVTLVNWQLPLAEMTKKDAMYPIECLQIVPKQKYNFKLDELQTANMIKFAVSRPSVREAAINEGKGWLNWKDDRYLKEFGLLIEPNMIKTKARLLPNPKIQFGGSILDPGTQGRWDLRGKKFFSTNPEELNSWGIGCFPGRTRIEKTQIDNFAQSFIKQYRAHGGRVASKAPHVMMLEADAGKGVEALYQGTGTAFQKRPQLLIFLCQNKESFHYLRVKKSTDCRYGIVSQCLQVQQVVKNNLQYISNVLMKVNAKLGGCTSKAMSTTPVLKDGLKPYTMIIGADVSHASPGSDQPSTAALSISMDKHAGRYAAAVQTNGHRVEMITEANFKSMLWPIANYWAQNVGGGQTPKMIYYIRDGVSEGQYQHVLQQEVPRIKTVMDRIAGGNDAWKGQITVIIASKRHHVRAFPNPSDKNSADKNGNPLPGAVIERDCTSPHEWDFYLYSHIALQGTSRPVHYAVIRDDAKHPPNVLMNMIYEHCYQYMRSTTSVSLHPAVYYAHLASNRAKSHENIPSSDGPKGGPGFKMTTKVSDQSPQPTEVPALIPLFDQSQIKYQMWYI